MKDDQQAQANAPIASERELYKLLDSSVLLFVFVGAVVVAALSVMT